MKILSKSFLKCFALASTLTYGEAYSTLHMRTESRSRNVDMRNALTPKSSSSRRTFFSKAAIATASTLLPAIGSTTMRPLPASAVGPVKIDLLNPVYSAAPCPPSRPIPGEKAMKGMRGLCVTVKADLKNATPKDISDVGIYGFVTDAVTGDSVLANNPDLSTDAGQFSMVKSIQTTDTSIEFEFVAAVPREKDISQYDNGIGELAFNSLRIINFPGGQQYGAISPCEMDEFSLECEDWEAENGPYVKREFMVKSNPRTKGR